MIKSINYWACEGGLEGTRPVAEAVDEVKAAGFAGIELCIGENGVLTPSTDQKTCEQYRDLAVKKGLVLETLSSGMSWGCCPTSPDPTVREKAITLHEGALQRAAWLGCKAMLYVPGAVTVPFDPGFKPVPYEKAYVWAKEAIKRLAATAEKVGVDLCVENVWNGLFYSPIEFASVIDEMKSNRVGVYFDIANGIGAHQHPPHWIEYLGKRIKRVHIKDYSKKLHHFPEAFTIDLLTGDQPWQETLAALRKIGYNSTLVAEMLPPTPGVIQRTSAAMDKIMAMAKAATG
jgi:L-ribulose-5-phosphate 3-epimerase